MPVLSRYASVAVTLLNTLLLFVVLNVGAAVALKFWVDTEVPVPPYVREALRKTFPALTNDELRTLIVESAHDLAYEPFTGFKEKVFHGRYVNIEPGGYRASAQQGPWPLDHAYYNVFVFGGSTTFGSGVADDQTVASYLQTDLRSLTGRREPKVYNFGRGAYYSSQERALFERLLLAGMRPDSVIFIDGLNEFHQLGSDLPDGTSLMADWVERRARPRLSEVWDALPMSQVFVRLGWYVPQRLSQDWSASAAGSGTPAPAVDDPEVTERVLALYRRNVRMIRAIAGANQIAVTFVWQPVPMYKYDLKYHTFNGNFGPHEYARYGYPRAAAAFHDEPVGADFVWCADIQEARTELLYVDQVHYSPAMSGMVARCISGHLSGP